VRNRGPEFTLVLIFILTFLLVTVPFTYAFTVPPHERFAEMPAGGSKAEEEEGPEPEEDRDAEEGKSYLYENHYQYLMEQSAAIQRQEAISMWQRKTEVEKMLKEQMGQPENPEKEPALEEEDQKEETEPIPPEEPDPKETASEQNAKKGRSLNAYVLDEIKAYRGRSYPYLLNNDYSNYNGVTENLVYQGRLLLKAHPSGNRASHCVGITFEVFFKAMQRRNRDLGKSPDDFNGMSWEELYDFALTWYVANGPKDQSNVAVAVEKYGLGKRIWNLEDARAGDFIDISRDNDTGHTAVFIEWIRKNGKIIGLKYWSSQSSTGGIGYKTEYFNVPDENGKPYGNVLKDQVYIARVYPEGLK